jgi:hypothetical protein
MITTARDDRLPNPEVFGLMVFSFLNSGGGQRNDMFSRFSGTLLGRSLRYCLSFCQFEARVNKIHSDFDSNWPFFRSRIRP